MTAPRSYLRRYCDMRCCKAHRDHMGKAERLEAKEKQDRRCAQCKAPLPASKRADAIYCSKACKRQVMMQRFRKRAPLTCLRCGAGFTCSTGSRLYCGDDCHTAAIRQQRKDRSVPLARLQRATCRWCSATFTPRRTPPLQVLCSPECDKAERKAKHEEQPERACPTCSTPFRPERPSDPRKYCSRSCAAQGRVLPREDRSCAICSTTFRPAFPSVRAITCSPSCASFLHYQRRRVAITCEAIS